MAASPDLTGYIITAAGGIFASICTAAGTVWAVMVRTHKDRREDSVPFILWQTEHDRWKTEHRKVEILQKQNDALRRIRDDS